MKKLLLGLLVVAAAVVVVVSVDAGPSFLNTSIKYIFSNGISVTGGTVDFTGATITGADFFDGETVTLANDESISNATDGTITLGRDDAGVLSIVAADDDATAALTITPGGAAALTLGGASTTAVTVTTDSTGNAEVVLPSASVGSAELGGATLRVTYCGQNVENGEVFFGPPVITAAEPVLADATCDALESATEATADVVLSAGLALTPKYMRCILNGTLGAAETMSYQLRDDTANVSGVTCSMAVGETTCEVAVPTASAVAAGSATAVEGNQSSDNTDDDSKCVVLYQVQ